MAAIDGFPENPDDGVNIDETDDPSTPAARSEPTGEKVVLPLGEPSKIDRLMPEIEHLREQENWSWKKIAKHFKIHPYWAAEYYKRRNSATSS